LFTYFVKIIVLEVIVNIDKTFYLSFLSELYFWLKIQNILNNEISQVRKGKEKVLHETHLKEFYYEEKIRSDLLIYYN